MNVVIFTVREGVLHVLLSRRPDSPEEPYPGRWALPGDFVDVALDATLEACARRQLKEKTGLGGAYLEPLGSWGGARRDPRSWSATHVYFSLMPADRLRPAKMATTAEGVWFRVDDMRPRTRLAFDHGEILDTALVRLRSKVEYTSLPAFLLVQPFTLPQLQAMYEAVLARTLDKSGFRTRMLAAGFLEEIGSVAGPSKRPAMGYRLRSDKAPVVFPRTFSPREG